MIKSVNDYPMDVVFKNDAEFCYVIPKYQRGYAWGQNQWRDIYDDITENDFGYFIGSIICIDSSSDAYQLRRLEVVDGQQRLTTISLLLVAIYNYMKSKKDLLDEDDLDELSSLRKSIICKGAPNGIIICPQIDGNNLSDYMHVMHENGLVKESTKEKNWGTRRIARCYKYFLKRIQTDCEKSDDVIKTLLVIKRKVLKSIIVKIEVESHAEAYTLFETLNNRGTPLTFVELMKNLILARAERAGLSCDECYDRWQVLMGYLTDDYAIQERFFRQYYNAFKTKLNEPFRNGETRKKDPLGSIATRSNLLSILEELIEKDLQVFLGDVICCGEIYSWLILSGDVKQCYKTPLEKLSHIQGAPSYMLLMYLFRNQEVVELSDDDIVQLINLLTKFFVRRNITDTPGTRDLIRIFMNIIGEIEDRSIKGYEICEHVHMSLKKLSASDKVFAESLQGSIYEENIGVARFVLCELAEKEMTKETWTDLWERTDSNKSYIWTIEHIFPEGKNIPKCWVDMIADGERTLAEEYLERYVHKLGNLTLTGYNSTLGNLSFVEKRDRVNSKKKYVGYKNGLEINKEIALKDKWTIIDIEDRTKKMVEDLLEMYQF